MTGPPAARPPSKFPGLAGQIGEVYEVRMRRNAPMKKFASILAEANFTTTQTGNLHEHIESKRKGL